MKKTSALYGACLISLAWGTEAVAQTTVAPAPAVPLTAAPAVADIVVTATRRSERLQDVPIAVTAVTSAGLAQKQISDVMGLAKTVPGLQTKPALNAVQLTIAIRGVTQLNAGPTIDPPIGVYVDGVYNVINAGTNAALIDVDRVEVLKGPQGTLFGRNTIGGAISIVTTKPEDQFKGYAQVDVGNYSAITTTGLVNTPLVPGILDARVVYQHSQHGRYGTDLVNGNPTNTLNQDFVRGTLKFDPVSSWDFLISGYYLSSKGYAPASKLGYNNSAFNASYPLASGNTNGDLLSNYINRGGFQDSYSYVSGTFNLRQYGLTGTITGHLNDNISVKSITGYTHTALQQRQDFDATPYTVTDLYAYPVRGRQISEELQLFGNAFANRLKWIAGVYYFTVDASQIGTSEALINFSPPAARFLNVQGPIVSNQSYSGFAQGTFDLTNRIRLTGGFRYVVDKRAVTYRDYRAAPATGAFLACNLANAANLDITSPTAGNLGADQSNCHFSASARYHYIPWTIGVDFKPGRDILLYAKLSQGYRSGAYPPNSGPAATVPSATVSRAAAVAGDQTTLAGFAAVPPEKLLSPEIGAKLQFFDRKLTINAAGYYSRYDNIQLTQNLILCTGCAVTNTVVNSGNASIWGGEVEVTALLGKLQLNGSLGHTDPKYTRGSLNYGLPVVNVSKWNGAISGTYPIDLAAGRISLTGTYSYRSTATFFSYTAATPAAEAAAVSQKGFGLFDARASLDLAHAPITISVYGQNLANKHYKVSGSAFPAPLSYATYLPGSPLTVGGSIQVRF